MSKVIYKYLLNVHGLVPLPDGAKLLHCDIQGNSVCGWFEVDLSNAERPYHTAMVGTGHVVPEGLVHCNTVLEGDFVWHFYVEPSLLR